MMPPRRKSNLSAVSKRARAKKVFRRNESDVDAEARRRKQTERQAASRAKETPEQSLARRTKDAERQRSRRAAETARHTKAAKLHAFLKAVKTARHTKVAKRHASLKAAKTSKQSQRRRSERLPLSYNMWATFDSTAFHYNPLIDYVQINHHLGQKQTANSGVMESVKTYSKSLLQDNPNLLVINGKRHLDDTAASYFLDVPEVPGSNLYLTSLSMMSIKIHFNESDHDANHYKQEVVSLGLQLKEEGFLSSPVRWLVKKGYIKSTSPCYVCKGATFLRDNPKFRDDCSWSCQNKECQFENLFKRPIFFARFPNLHMAHILVMIFHWTVQTDAAFITPDVPMAMDLVKISHAWRAIQKLCRSALKREKCKIGGPNLLVEVALVQYGENYVLGAYDRSSNLSFLKAFPSHLLTSEMLNCTLKSWINPGTIVIVNADKSLKLPPEFHVSFADCNVRDKKSTTSHVLNVTSYLLHHVSVMFGDLRADMIRPESMQVFLDELMWRERNGRKPQLAFSKIMHEIFHYEVSGKPHDIEDPKEPEQESLSPIKLKEARVVLRRIPKTVLKLYNCLPPASHSEM